MNAFFFWEEAAGGLTLEHRCNPYAGLLARALERLDIHLELGRYAFEREWLESNRKEYEVLHLNWPHHFYRADDLETTINRYSKFADNLTFAHRIGYRIVWTMHNLYPHERPFPEVDHMGRLLITQIADDVIAHCDYAADLARRKFYRSHNLHVIPHGNFIDAYPNEVSREEGRRKLGISEEAFVYIFFGNVRGYKGIESLLDAFCKLKDPDALLILMMRQWGNDVYIREMGELARRDKRIRVFTSSYFPDKEFQIYLNSSDVAVFPFSEVLTSGSAITALSFGKPLILPKLGCMVELIDENSGILYDPKDDRGLEKALAEIRNHDIEANGREAFQIAKNLNWDSIASRIAEVYRRKWEGNDG